MNNDEQFNYSYSAPNESERREIEGIKKQYVAEPKKESGLEELRRLNRRVMLPPRVIGALTGIVGALTMGVGMAMVLEWNIMLWGVIVGVVGIAILAVVYPVYRAILKRNKRKYGQQIIELSNELLNEEK